MVERGRESSWTHFEVVAEGGWFKNLLYGKQPFIEVAFENRQSLLLNPGVPKANRSLMPEIPAKWSQKDHISWAVPTADIEELIFWVDTCLAAVSGRTDYRVSGWIEGL
jgi:hypothetical protein